MKIIYTKNNDEILVDDNVYEWASLITWYIHTTGYARHICSKDERLTTGKRFVFLHCLIIDCPKNMVRDHINGNKLDNRKTNLRICTRTQNLWNSKIISKNNTSGYKGVSFKKETGRWCARIQFIHLGYFDNPEDAARAYDKEARKYFGEFAKTNF